ncbi:DUF4123 domain-containing protein [Pseudomonas silesiensis]|jgi:hypothetical protein|uniref:DUF4123 domain-containing protein n=1 Tax=Pseudomonas silesiensis TaxID=1853130 RepID=UPI0034D3DF41
MTSVTPEKGLLLLDGARYEDAIDWLYQHYGSDNPQSLFKGTAYESICAAGPFLLDASLGSAAYTAWWGGSDLQHGVWLASTKNAQKLLPTLQRRLRIFDEQQRELWLRLADGAVLNRAWLAGAQWPTGFWFGVDSVWLRHGNEQVCAWENEAPEYDSAPANKGLAAQITLPELLLQALSLPANPEKNA